MPLINAKNLEKTYYTYGVKTEALRGVTFSIEKGEFVAIMGPSGSGKSTLLHILGFLDSNTGGTYTFDGRSFDEYTPNEISRVRNEKMGFVFQSYNLLARTTVLDNVKLPLLYSQIPEKEWGDLALKAIDAVGLTHRTRHESSQLSGGEKQRVAIARALICEPEIIFADEPTGDLDSKTGKAVMDIIARLNKDKGHTIIIITHDKKTASHAKRTITILDGKIYAPAPRRRVLQRKILKNSKSAQIFKPI